MPASDSPCRDRQEIATNSRSAQDKTSLHGVLIIMPHDHHYRTPPSGASNASFKIALLLNVMIVVTELVAGFLAHSVALIADAGHNFADVLLLAFALGANVLAARPPTARRTYGFRRTTILAALLNAIIILITTGAIVYSAIQRILSPVSVNGEIVWMVAALAIVLNAVSAMMFNRHRKHDLNARAAFLHLAGDAAASSGVLVAGLIIVWTGAQWTDPAVSIIIAVLIALATWTVLRDSFNLAADAVPTHIDQVAIEQYLRSIEGVTDVHDLHIWAMSTTHVVLTAHLIIPERSVEDELLFDISRMLHDRFGVEHTTLQVERGSLACELASSEVI
jgi:cobalt-zinc-cadmium efflux system protein